MEQVLKIDPNHAEALNFIGYSYADRGIHLREAERMIRKALKISPGSGFIIDSLGWLYFRQNKFDLAIKYLREAAALLPEDGTVAEHLGDVYARTGRWQEALEAYDRALKLTPDNEGLKKKVQELQKKKSP
jgi:tetratricopeptide (TPR) repeat protein